MVKHNDTQLDLVFHALADPTRREILRLIAQRDYTITELAEPFTISLAAISKHIKILEKAGLLIRNKEGRIHYCRLESRPLKEALESIDELQQYWDKQFMALEEYLTQTLKPSRRKKMSFTLVVKKVINASCDRVFNAWSKPDIMGQWLKPNSTWHTVTTADFKIGGSYKHDMVDQEGKAYTHIGEYKEIVPHKKIVFTWNSLAVSNTLVTVEFKDLGEKTEVTLTHSQFTDEDQKNRHNEGWKECMNNLESVMSEQSTATPSFHCATTINATPEKVYQAITQENGLKEWWTTTCTAENKVGGEAIFHFGNIFNTMKIVQLMPHKIVQWECINQYDPSAHLKKHDEWIGTTLTFQLKQNNSGGTDLDFTHEGLTSDLECYNVCFSAWSHFLKKSLKNYVETGKGQPYNNGSPF